MGLTPFWSQPLAASRLNCSFSQFHVGFKRGSGRLPLGCETILQLLRANVLCITKRLKSPTKANTDHSYGGNMFFFYFF